MTDWIEWNGGECPVGGEKEVEVRYRDGSCPPKGRARGWFWGDRSDAWDIIAYRLVDAPGASTDVDADFHADLAEFGAAYATDYTEPSALSHQPTGTHYSDAAIQPVQFIEANKLGFLEGCIVKRATRHSHPTGKGAEDVRKIIHEAQLLLQLRYGEVA